MGPKPRAKKPIAGNSSVGSAARPTRRPGSARGCDGSSVSNKNGTGQPSATSTDGLAARAVARKPAAPIRGRPDPTRGAAKSADVPIRGKPAAVRGTRKPAVPIRGNPAAARGTAKPASARGAGKAAIPSKDQPAAPRDQPAAPSIDQPAAPTYHPAAPRDQPDTTSIDQSPPTAGPDQYSILIPTADQLDRSLPKEPPLTGTQDFDQKQPYPLEPLQSFNTGGVVTQASADLVVQRLKAISSHGSQEDSASTHLATGGPHGEMSSTEKADYHGFKQWDCSIDSKEWSVDENNHYNGGSKQWDCSIDSKEWGVDSGTDATGTELEFRWGWDGDGRVKGKDLRPGKAGAFTRDFSLVDLSHASREAPYKVSEEPTEGAGKVLAPNMPSVKDGLLAGNQPVKASPRDARPAGATGGPGWGITRLFRRSPAGQQHQPANKSSGAYVKKPESLADAANRVGKHNMEREPDTGCGCF